MLLERAANVFPHARLAVPTFLNVQLVSMVWAQMRVVNVFHAARRTARNAPQTIVSVNFAKMVVLS